MGHGKAGTRPIALGIIVGLTYSLLRADIIGVVEPLTVLLVGWGVMAFWLAVMIDRQLVTRFHHTLLWPAGLVLAVMLLLLGFPLTLVAQGALLAFVVSGFLYVTPQFGLVGPLVAILALVLTPPILWPHQHPVTQLALALLVASALGLTAAEFSIDRRAAAPFRLFAYLVWMLPPIYIALQMWPSADTSSRDPEWQRWVVLLGGVGAVIGIGMIVERLYRGRLRWGSVLEWLLQREALAAVVERKVNPTDGQLEEAQLVFESMSASRPQTLLDAFFVDALLCQRALDELWGQVVAKRIQEHPSTIHLVRRRVFDLPSGFDSTMRLYSDSRLWALLAALPAAAEDSFGRVLQKEWNSFLKKRRELIDALTKSGELAKLLRATPKPDTAFKDGLLLDHGPDTINVIEEWARLLSDNDKLSPVAVLGEDRQTATQIAILLEWVNAAKRERDGLIRLSDEWRDKAEFYRKALPRLTIAAVLLFLEQIIEQGWPFEALKLIDVALSIWHDRPAVDALQRLRAQAEFDLLTLDQPLPAANVTAKLVEQALDDAHVYVANATRNIATPEGVALHIVVKGPTAACFDLPVDQGRWLAARAGQHELLVSTYDSRFPPIGLTWTVNTKSLQEVKVVLATR